MGKIRWTKKASYHLKSIYDYIARDSKIYAEQYVKSLIKSTKKLEFMPECGRKVPELEGYFFREIFYKNHRQIPSILKS